MAEDLLTSVQFNDLLEQADGHKVAHTGLFKFEMTNEQARLP